MRQDARGRGLGHQILVSLLDLAGAHGYHSVMARVVAENEASLHLHAGHGFRVVGVDREVAFKQGRWLDVVILQRLRHA